MIFEGPEFNTLYLFYNYIFISFILKKYTYDNLIIINTKFWEMVPTSNILCYFCSSLMFFWAVFLAPFGKHSSHVLLRFPDEVELKEG